MKISTNSSLAHCMPDIIKIDAGGIVFGETSNDQMGDMILGWVIRVPSREIRTKAELLARDDFIPYKRGGSL
jgi:altronate dehydratase